MKQRETNVKIVTLTVFIATFMTAIEATILADRNANNLGDFKGWRDYELGVFHLFINECHDDAYLWEVN